MKNPDGQLLHGNAETLVLSLIAENESYGYQIRKRLAVRSHRYFQFGFGRLYPILHGLEQRRLVTARWGEAGRIRQRKNYRITPTGRDALQQRKDRWRQFARAMELVLNRQPRTANR